MREVAEPVDRISVSVRALCNRLIGIRSPGQNVQLSQCSFGDCHESEQALVEYLEVATPTLWANVIRDLGGNGEGDQAREQIVERMFLALDDETQANVWRVFHEQAREAQICLSRANKGLDFVHGLKEREARTDVKAMLTRQKAKQLAGGEVLDN